ncbi:MAG: hypothetical protein B7X08_01955 [Acidocella sp. 20-63-7]|nr:MAG: hypothetical protein B7X08_01955 [Acidocella sp. 20-63-7]
MKSLIRASESQVQAGVDRVGKTGEVLVRLSSQVGEVDQVVREISASTAEQASALAQINEAVNSMDHGTQQTAAMVEETTAASHSLGEEVRFLASLSAQFDVGQPAAAKRATQPQSPRNKARQMAEL